MLFGFAHLFVREWANDICVGAIAYISVVWKVLVRMKKKILETLHQCFLMTLMQTLNKHNIG